MKRAYLFPAAIALGAVLGLFAVQGVAAEASQVSGEAQLIAAPLPPPSVASLDSAFLRPGLPDTPRTPVDRGLDVVPDLGSPAAAGRPSVLVSTLILEKYRPFRESLTSP